MKEEIYIDFDGVIMDTQKIIDYYFEMFGSDVKSERWNRFLRELDWFYVLKDSKEINNSLEVLRQLSKLRDKVFILSRVFSDNETMQKENFLRDNGVNQLFIPVMGRIPKSRVIIPNPNRLLVDNSMSNITDWKDNGGNTIIFPEEEKDLKFLLKRKVR